MPVFGCSLGINDWPVWGECISHSTSNQTDLSPICLAELSVSVTAQCPDRKSLSIPANAMGISHSMWMLVSFYNISNNICQVESQHNLKIRQSLYSLNPVITETWKGYYYITHTLWLEGGRTQVGILWCWTLDITLLSAKPKHPTWPPQREA